MLKKDANFMTTPSQSIAQKPTVIAIVGASASGKTLFAQTIFDELLPELGDEKNFYH